MISWPLSTYCSVRRRLVAEPVTASHIAIRLLNTMVGLFLIRIRILIFYPGEVDRCQPSILRNMGSYLFIEVILSRESTTAGGLEVVDHMPPLNWLDVLPLSADKWN